MGFFSDLFDDVLDPQKRARESALKENQRQGDISRGRNRAIAAGTGFASDSRLARLDSSVLDEQRRQTARIHEQFSSKSQLGGILGTLGGALIGSFIAPGVGTAVGASIGGSLFGGSPGLASAFGGGGSGPAGSIPTAGLTNFDTPGQLPNLVFPGQTGPTAQGTANTSFLFPQLFRA